MIGFRRTFAVAWVVAAVCISGSDQTVEQPVVLTIEVENMVMYRADVTDTSKLAQDPGVTTPLGAARAFQSTHSVGDIVAVNEKPAKGLLSNWAPSLIPRVNAQPGQMIADHNGNVRIHCFWQIVGPDGNSIGDLVDDGGAPGPSHTITGGSGAFFGVIGEHRTLQSIQPTRIASVSEDPANRRIHGGGRSRFVFRLYPRYRPSVDVSPTGPAVFHTDFSPVTATSPARVGEVLIAAVRNLGPTRPELLPPGSRSFKADPAEVVNSPVEVAVNGRDAEVINKLGWPGTSDLYRVDFRVPEGLAPGNADIQITAAWIPGPAVRIPVR